VRTFRVARRTRPRRRGTCSTRRASSVSRHARTRLETSSEATGALPEILERRHQKQIEIAALIFATPCGRAEIVCRICHTVSLATSQRSSVASEKDEIAQTVFVDTVPKFWGFLAALLKEIA